jgi:hypothetical protein
MANLIAWAHRAPFVNALATTEAIAAGSSPLGILFLDCLKRLRVHGDPAYRSCSHPGSGNRRDCIALWLVLLCGTSGGCSTKFGSVVFLSLAPALLCGRSFMPLKWPPLPLRPLKVASPVDTGVVRMTQMRSASNLEAKTDWSHTGKAGETGFEMTWTWSKRKVAARKSTDGVTRRLPIRVSGSLYSEGGVHPETFGSPAFM